MQLKRGSAYHAGMARTAPVPNIPPIPGMCPSVAVLAGGGDGGGGSGKGPGGGGGGAGAGAGGGGENAAADARGAPDFQKHPECGYASHPVDVVTGRAFTHPITDLMLPGPLPLELRRMYSSKMAGRDAGLGPGWAHSLGWEVEVGRREITVWNEQGVAVDFPMVPPGGEALGPWGWVLRREAWGVAVDANDGLWRIFSEAAGRGRLRLTAIEDRNRNRITLTYEDGRLAEVRDSAGRVVRVRTTPEGRLASLEALNSVARGQWVALARYEYDARGDLVAARDADGHAAHYEYDDAHRMVADTDRAGLTFRFVYDDKGRCVESWGEYEGREDPSLVEGLPRFLADGQTRVKGIHHCRFSFHDDGYSEVVDSTQVRRFFGNRHGLLDKSVDGGAVTTAAYDDQGFLLARTDPLGATTTFERDRRGRLLKVIEPLDRTTQIARDAAGLPVEVVDPAGGVTTFERDSAGNATILRNALGEVTRIRRDERGLPVEVTDASGGVGRITYDAQGNLTSITQANGGAWRYGYDAFGRRVSTTDPLGATRRNAFSDRGDLVAQYDASGGVQRFEYDGEGHLTREVSPSGAATTYRWGGYHKLCARTDAAGHTIELRYNLEGELVLVRDARGAAHRLEYDTSGRLIGEATIDGRTLRYRNDALGRMVLVETGAGERTELVYNPLGELIERAYADGSKEAFAYDALGELIEASGPGGVVRVERDPLGRVIREAQIVGDEEVVVEVEYDAHGRRAARRTSRGHDEAIERDAIGARVRTVLDGGFEIAHGNDVLGRETERRLPGGGRILSAFDAEGRLGRRRALAPSAHRPAGPGEPEWIGPRDAGVTAERAYAYDLDGELVEAIDGQRGSTRYEYDPVGRLVAMVPAKARAYVFRHDPAGNLHEGEGREGDGKRGAPRRYEQGRLVQRGATQYLWDGEGRLSEKRVAGEAGEPEAVWRYSWDGAGLLRAVEGPSGEIVELAYDPLARRVEKRVSRVPGPGELPVQVSRTRFVWDGDQLVHEIKETARRGGDPIIEERTYCFEDDSHEPAAQRDGGAGGPGGWLAYMNDPAGAPDRLVAADGSVACELERGPWGRMRPAAGSRAETPLRLQGQYEDEETGLAYNRFRYYDAEAARFIAPDPIGLDGGIHPYLFAPSAESWIDPLGLRPLKPTILGENMRDRVLPTAAAEGYHTFNVKSRFKPGDAGADKAWEKNQRRWMQDQCDSGRQIFDIGEDPTRPTRSKYCGIENKVLNEEGFSRQCTGRTLNVNGVPTPLYEWVPPPGFTPGDGRKRRNAARGRS